MDRRRFLGSTLLASIQFSMGSKLRGWPLPTARRTGDAAASQRFASTRLGLTDPITPTFDEDCQLTPTYGWPPGSVLDASSVGDNGTQRLNDFFRGFAAARDAQGRADPRNMLANAVLVAMGRGVQPRNVPPAFAAGMARFARQGIDPELATALAQLAVTGRAAYSQFALWNPQTTDLVALVRQLNADPTLDVGTVAARAGDVLDAAYTTAWALRANDAGWRTFRARMPSAGKGWVCTSGEDDLPHRPVNIASAAFPQYDIPVHVVGNRGPLTIITRYMIASGSNFLGGGASAPSPAQGSLRKLPIEIPYIPPDERIIIYLHGGGSRLEEAELLAAQLIAEGSNIGQKYTVIAMDLPNTGYCGWRQGLGGPADLSPFDHTDVADPTSTPSYHPSPDKNAPRLTHGTWTIEGYPIMGFEERFIISFIDALEQQHGRIKERIVAVMGGSLGGNMSLQLSRRCEEYPFLRTIVAWSSTCMAFRGDIAHWLPGHQIAGVGGDLVGKSVEPEQPRTRDSFFEALYRQPLANLQFGGVGIYIPPQPTMWWRADWPCFRPAILQSRYDRYEYYTANFRRWTHRLDYEMAVFCFQEGDVYPPNHAVGPLRHLTMGSDRVGSQLLLVAAADDDYEFVNNYSQTRYVAGLMTNTPGTTLFLNHTGHSIHDERPKFFAQQIVKFVGLPKMTIAVAIVSETASSRTINVSAKDRLSGAPLPDAVVSVNGVTGRVGVPLTYPLAIPPQCRETVTEASEVVTGPDGKPHRTTPLSYLINDCVGTVSKVGYLTANFDP